MLQLKDICKSYTTGSFTQKALDNVSIAFRDNEFVAILGPSGSGKTTLLNIVGGLDHYDSGDLVIDGVSTKKYKDRDWDTYRNNRIGFVFQSYNLIPHQTVLANVELALTLSGVSRDERRKRAIEALERVGLGDHIDKKPAQMSGGQMQRVAIARALINDPEILLADEPTGALDSKTSVQIMDLLTEIASDRLVVMVTHNPELAEQYATRIVNLADGVIRSDTDPYIPSEAEISAANAKPVRRTSMSFLTALSLSANNLMTKKGRTIMTAIAGSIGIIGIAAILALANGVNNYIKTVEEETLSVYPLQIMSSGFDMTSMFVGMSGNDDDEESVGEDSNVQAEANNPLTREPEEGKIGEVAMMSRMFASFGNNDLAALKEYFDSGESKIEDYTNNIYYEYAVTPQIFSADTSNGARQINPDSSFSALGFGGSASSSNSLISMSMSTDVFSEMMGNDPVVMSQYDVVAGHWPEKHNELVLVLSRTGRISDFTSYVLGLRDPEVLKEMVKQFANEEEVDAPEDELEIDYDDILGMKFKLVSATRFYKHDDEYNVWVDKSDDKDYMRQIVDEGEDIEIAGIVQPKPEANALALTQGIYYTPALTRHIVEVAADSQIVKDQLADSKRDVFSGKSFDELDDEQNDGFNMESLFSVDGDALSAAFKFDPNAFNMSNLDFSGMDFSGMDLSSLDLSSIDLSKIDLSGLDLSKLGLDQIDLQKLAQDAAIDPSTLDLSGVDLSGVQLPEPDFSSIDTSKLPALTTEDIEKAFPEVTGDNFRKVFSGIDVQFTDGGKKLNGVASEITQGYVAWQIQHPTGSPSEFIQTLDLQKYLSTIVSSVNMPNLQEQITKNIAKQLKTTPDELGQVVSQRIAGLYSQEMLEAMREQINESLQKYLTESAETLLPQIAEQYMPVVTEQIMPQVAEKILPKLYDQYFSKIASKVASEYLPKVVEPFAKQLGTVLQTQIGNMLRSVFSQLASNMSNAMGFDEEAFTNAFKFNMNPDELSELMMSMMRVEEHSYDNNLKKLGYADFAKPSEISIYPKDFESKEHVIEILDTYNDNMKAVDEDKVISYTDIVGTLMESVTDIVNMISYVLIAFVAISLIVSSIMIGVITYISVLERKKEIGILRSIGASKGDVSRVFNAETVIEGLIAGLLGVGITALGCIPANIIVYNMFDVPNVALLPVDAAAILVAISVVLTFVAGLIPSGSASRKDPVEALRSE